MLLSKFVQRPIRHIFFLCALAFVAMSSSSCYHTTNPKLYYDIDTLMQNVYVNSTDSTVLSLYVKFLTGSEEPITLSIAGLPPKVTLSQDSITGTPNFYANFVFHADSATLGIYPATLVTYSSTNHLQYRNFNIVIVLANCAKPLAGNYAPTYACSPNYYNVDSVGIRAVTNNTINISNIGGYGPTTITSATLNCNTDSIYISRQNIGNGITLYGKGYINNANQVIINYTAVNPPTATGDSMQCTMTLNR